LGEIRPGDGALAFDVEATDLAVVEVAVSRVGEDLQHDRPELAVGFRGADLMSGEIFPGVAEKCLAVGETGGGVHRLGGEFGERFLKALELVGEVFQLVFLLGDFEISFGEPDLGGVGARAIWVKVGFVSRLNDEGEALLGELELVLTGSDLIFKV
jgi:hypothetical protein